MIYFAFSHSYAFLNSHTFFKSYTFLNLHDFCLLYTFLHFHNFSHLYTFFRFAYFLLPLMFFLSFSYFFPFVCEVVYFSVYSNTSSFGICFPKFDLYQIQFNSIQSFKFYSNSIQFCPVYFYGLL